MLTPQQVLRITIEIIFVLLGGLVVWLGLSGHILFDRRKPGWLLLSIALILWACALSTSPGNGGRVKSSGRATVVDPAGLGDAGDLARALRVGGALLAFAGVLLALRGLVGSALILRPR